jgi:hypothetical protein
MKRNTPSILALAAILLTSGYLLGQGQPKAAPAAPAAKPTRLVKIATLNTAKDNQEFQANVQLVQAQRQKAIELNGAIEKEKDATKKKALQKELDELMVKLNQNNEIMIKTYGFSLTRDYTLEIEKANIYLHATEEEAARIEKAAKEQEKKSKK